VSARSCKSAWREFRNRFETLPGRPGFACAVGFAGLQRLAKNRDDASVVAPFDGVITQRNVDISNVVQGNTDSGTFMFAIMQKDVIRVWVCVPQNAAFGVAPAVDAIVSDPASRQRHPAAQQRGGAPS
jgi:multidrug efflux pump subunit AcrA (membrane-fusion protein)